MLAAALAIGAAMSIVLLTLGTTEALTLRQKAVAVRLRRYGTVAEEEQALDHQGLIGELENLAFALERWLTRSFPFSAIRLQLARAYLDWSLRRYLSLVALSFLGLFLIVWLLVGSPRWALLFALPGLFLPYLYLLFRQQGMAKRFQGQLQEAIGLLASSIRAGHSPIHALEAVAQEIEIPLSLVFSRVVRDVHVGFSLDEALESLARRAPIEDIALFALVLLVHHRAGGNLAGVLDSLATTLRERDEIRREIASLTAQQRLTSYVLLLLPIGLGVLLFLLNPLYMGVLFTTTIGRGLLLAAITLLSIGFVILRQMSEIEA